MSSSTSTYVKKEVSKFCKYGLDCKISDCKFTHPAEWQTCAKSLECEDKYCKLAHPRGYVPVCRKNIYCENKTCKFRHIKELCRYEGNECRRLDCKYSHIEYN